MPSMDFVGSNTTVRGGMHAGQTTCLQAPKWRGEANNMPRVPSLVFDIELEEQAKAGVFFEEEPSTGLRQLKAWLQPSSSGEAQLRADVEQAMRSNPQQQQVPEAASNQQPALPAVNQHLPMLQHLATHLGRRGYYVCIRTALGGGDGQDCLKNLRHAFLLVLPPGAHATTNRFVVDLSFKEQFRIAKPTPRYQSCVDCLPDVYVAPEGSIAPLVTFLCQEMASAFKSTGTVLPPWRTGSSMLSKWLPRKSMDEQVIARTQPPQAGTLQQQQQQLVGSYLSHRRSVNGLPTSSIASAVPIQGHWMKNPTLSFNFQAQAAAAAAALAAQQAAAIRPIACEPKRVVVGGNFSSIGFP